jgi:hypothetical protein
MKQEDKELLLKDLCARSPYGVKIFVNDNVKILEGVHMLDKVAWYDGWCASDIEEVKPYLFPLSSMTDEQIMQSPASISIGDLENLRYINKLVELEYGTDVVDLIDWFNKNHFDYRGLIPMGLANDATGLNIY